MSQLSNYHNYEYQVRKERRKYWRPRPGTNKNKRRGRLIMKLKMREWLYPEWIEVSEDD